MLISDEEFAKRKKELILPTLHNDTPWQEIYRKYVDGLADGACLKLQKPYTKILDTKWYARDSH
jgi:dihydroxy-acid dehydratase